jgi:hypothetical protein
MTAGPTKSLQVANPHRNKHLWDLAQWMVHSACGLCHSEVRARTIVRGLPPLLHAGLRRTPLLYGLLVEIRSLLCRMALRYMRRYNLYGIDFGPAHQTTLDGRLELNARTYACIADIESFVAGHPWATIVDVEIYRDACVRGAAWADGNPGSCRQGNENSTRNNPRCL